MPGKPLGRWLGAQEWAGNTTFLQTKASHEPRTAWMHRRDQQASLVGHMDGDADDDTSFSGRDAQCCVGITCVILTEPHEVRAVQPTRGQTTAQTTQLIRGGRGGNCARLTPPRVARNAWPSTNKC